MSTRDSAGFGIALIHWGATLMVGGFLAMFLERPREALLSFEDEIEREAVHEGLAYMELAWDGLMFFILIFGFILFIAGAAARSGGFR